MRISTLTLGLLFVCMITSCSKDPGVDHDGTLSMEVNGVPVSFSQQSPGNIDDRLGEELFFSAITRPGNDYIAHFSLKLPGTVVPGNYSSRPGSADTLLSMQLILDQNYSDGFDAGLSNKNPISITITSRSRRRITGTFQATLTNYPSDTVVITNGVFDIPFVKVKPV